MNKLFLLLLFLAFLIVSCGEDTGTNPSKVDPDLVGNWTGLTVINKDSISSDVQFADSENLYKANASLIVITYSTSGSMTVRQEYKRSGTSTYTYTKPQLKINLLDETSYYFEGNMSEDKKSINGKVEIIVQDSIKTKIDIVLRKK